MESILAEVLILHGLGDDGFYKVVTRVGLMVLVEFEGRREEAHDLRASGETGARTEEASIPYL